LFHCCFAGHGVFVSVEGDLYKGTFRNDISHGRGVYVWPDGQVYLGDYVDGVREGKGYVIRIAFLFLSSSRIVRWFPHISGISLCVLY
jgi:hypothetical protein